MRAKAQAYVRLAELLKPETPALTRQKKEASFLCCRPKW